MKRGTPAFAFVLVILTKELALSGNAKVVIIGAGKEGLPIILGGDTSPATPHPASER